MTPTANRGPAPAPLRVALIQAPPVFLDLAGCLRVAETRLREAAATGATLVVFPETWLPGYPLWLDEAPGAALWDHPPTKALHRCLFDNSPRLDGPEIGRLRELAGELGTDLLERAERVQAAGRAGLGTILSIKARLQRLRDSGQQVVELAGGLPAAVVGVGVEAANCARGAITELQGAIANISVSVEVSVTVSGSIVAG